MSHCFLISGINKIFYKTVDPLGSSELTKVNIFMLLQSAVAKILKNKIRIFLDNQQTIEIYMSTFSLSISELLTNVQNNSDEIALQDLQSLITECNDEETSSVLRTNRGVAFHLSGQKQQAIEQLQKSVQNNHLNYVAYFDLFSMQFISNKNQDALKNLCCALSCLYLLRGKKQQKDSDITKAIKYCENNLEARLLKGLHYFQKGKFPLALNEINWVLQIQPNNEKFQTIKAGILKHMGKGEEGEKNIDNDAGHNKVMQSSFPAFDELAKRLQCTLYEEQELQCMNVFDEINKKLIQFTELYTEIIPQQTILVKKSPIIYLLGRIKKISSVPEKSKNLCTKQMFSSSLMIEEEHEEAVNSSADNMNLKQPTTTYPEEKKEEGNRSKFSQGFETQSINLSQMEPLAVSKNQEQSSLTSGMMVNSQNQSFSRTVNSGMPQSSSYTLHVLDDDKNLSIKVNKIDLSGIQEEQKQKLTNLYCQFEYGDQKYNTRSEGHSQNQDLLNHSFDAELEDQPQVLMISLYNKQIHAFKDRYIGTGAKEITTTGRLQVPMFKDNQKMQPIGKVIVDVKYK